MTKPKDKFHKPDELADLLATKEPLHLVGGQAVNLWALHYWKRTADLAPFVSRDVDVLGDLSTLEELATHLHTKPQIFPLRPPTNTLGVVIAHDKDGDPVLIEVLKYVHGVGEDELWNPTYTFEIGSNAVAVHVPGPVALFKAKVANLADLSQAGRQDEKHVQILARLLPDYWKDLCAAVTSGKVEERKLIKHLETILAVATSSKGKTILAKVSIETIFLFKGLESANLSKVQAFIKNRLIRFTKDPMDR
jgi:hypothetical protein